MSDIKPEQFNPGENAEIREGKFPIGERGDTTSFEQDGREVLTKDGPKSSHMQSQDEFWADAEIADQTPDDVVTAPPTDNLDPNQFPGEVANHGDATGDTESSVMIQ